MEFFTDDIGHTLANQQRPNTSGGGLEDYRLVAYQTAFAQAVRRRRRHQARRPPPAKIRPGSPAPAIGPGTLSPVSEKLPLNVGAGLPPTTSVPTRSQSGCRAKSRIQV